MATGALAEAPPFRCGGALDVVPFPPILCTTKSITIHKLDPELAQRLERKARAEGKSLNRIIKALLEESLGLSEKPPPDHRQAFEDLFGSWKPSEAEAFKERLKETRSVRADDWDR